MAEDNKADPVGAAAELASGAPDMPMDTGPKMIMGMPLAAFLLFALNALVMFGGLGYVTYIKLVYVKPPITDSMVVSEIQKKETGPASPADTGRLFTQAYSEMTVNLRVIPGGKNHYATISVVLGCRSAGCVDALSESKAKIEDTIQTVIGDHSYTELNSLEVKARIKYDIQQKINTLLKDKPVTDVFFENFIVQ